MKNIKNGIKSILISTFLLSANEISSGVAFDFLTIDSDARHSGLGGASSLIPGPVTGISMNPSLIAAYNKNNFGVSVSPLSADITIGAISGTYRFKNDVLISPSFRYLSVGSIESLDKNKEPLLLSVEPFSIDGGISIAYKLIPTFSTGITVHYAYEYLAPKLQGITSQSDASALLFDGGIYFLPTRNVALSAGLKNAGVFLKHYENDVSDLPISVYSGIRYFTKGTTQSNLLVEFEKERNFPLSIKPALELQLYKGIVTVRAGTSFSTNDVEHFFDVIKGDNSESQTYTKTESQLLALGGGLAVPLNDKSLFFDFATRFLGDGMGLHFAFSGGFSF